jgi:hypothetical protein
VPVMKARIMTKKAEPRESLGMRLLMRILVGTDHKASFLARHDWALPVLIYGSGLAIGIGTWWLAAQGWGDVLIWGAIVAGVVIGALTLHMIIQLSILTRKPLPALDRTERTATVVLNANDGERQVLLLQYSGADGESYNAQLADCIDDTWDEAFVPGSRWQVYAFRDPDPRS